MHLTPDDFVDLAEGTRPESSAPHLASCGACRAMLTDLRATLASVAGAEAPEPSPLFWDHLSGRVHDAVIAEENARLKPSGYVERLRGLSGVKPSRYLVALAAAALVVMLAVKAFAPARPASFPAPSAPPAPLASDANSSTEATGDLPRDDAPLRLVGDLASTLDADTAGEVGLTHVGSADHAVAHMNDVELRELKKLLRDELTPSGD